MATRRRDGGERDRSGSRSSPRVKDAGLPALLALGLCVPIVAAAAPSRTSPTSWCCSRAGDSSLASCAVVFVGRLLLLADGRRSRPGRRRAQSARRRCACVQRQPRRLRVGGLVLLLAYPWIALGLGGGRRRDQVDRQFRHPDPDLRHARLGAQHRRRPRRPARPRLRRVLRGRRLFLARCSSKNFGLSFWLCLPLAGILAAFWGILLGFPGAAPARRLSRHRHAGLRRDHPPRPDQLGRRHRRLCRHLRHPAADLLRHSRSTPPSTGFAATLRPRVLAAPPHDLPVLRHPGAGAADQLGDVRLRRLPVGRAWEALREDEIACRSLGINTVNTKLTAFAIGAVFGGFAGAFFAARQGFISPESFVFMESAMILAIVVLGGMGSQIGVAIAAIAMIGGTEILRELDWLKADLRHRLRSDAVPHADVRPGHGGDHDLAAARARSRARQPSVFLQAAAHDFRQISSRRATADALGRHGAAARGRAPDDALRRPRRRQRPVVQRPAAATSPR